MNTEQLFELRNNLQKSINVTEEELIAMDWRHLVNRDECILAIKSYRREHNVTLIEAKRMVDSFREMMKS